MCSSDLILSRMHEGLALLNIAGDAVVTRRLVGVEFVTVQKYRDRPRLVRPNRVEDEIGDGGHVHSRADRDIHLRGHFPIRIPVLASVDKPSGAPLLWVLPALAPADEPDQDPLTLTVDDAQYANDPAKSDPRESLLHPDAKTPWETVIRGLGRCDACGPESKGARGRSIRLACLCTCRFLFRPGGRFAAAVLL